MKFLPCFVALAAISAASVPLTAKSVSPREVSLSKVQEDLQTEPIEISVERLALPIKNRNEFQESLIPKDVNKLAGRRVRLVGQMFPTFKQTGLTEFVFAGDIRRESKWYNITSSKIPPVHYLISVRMQEGTTFDFIQRTPIAVEGRLVIEPEFVEGELFNLYQIKNAAVVPTKRQEGFKASIGVGC